MLPAAAALLCVWKQFPPVSNLGENSAESATHMETQVNCADYCEILRVKYTLPRKSKNNPLFVCFLILLSNLCLFARKKTAAYLKHTEMTRYIEHACNYLHATFNRIEVWWIFSLFFLNIRTSTSISNCLKLIGTKNCFKSMDGIVFFCVYNRISKPLKKDLCFFQSPFLSGKHFIWALREEESLFQ